MQLKTYAINKGSIQTNIIYYYDEDDDDDDKNDDDDEDNAIYSTDTGGMKKPLCGYLPQGGGHGKREFTLRLS